MDRFLTWGGNTWVLLILLMLAARDFDTYHWPTHFNGGSAAILVNGICLLLFAVPLVSLQVLFGQYAKTGPLGIWRSFPLARGVGIVWIIFIFITISLNVTQDSNILVYTYTTLSSTKELPWLTCNNAWNTKDCQPYTFINSTQPATQAAMQPMTSKPPQPMTPSPASFDLYELENEYENSFESSEMEYNTNITNITGRTPAEEYEDTFRRRGNARFNSQNILSVIVLWVLMLLPLVQGLKSLVKCFFIWFLLLSFLNALLFFRAISLPNTGIGLRSMLRPEFEHVNYMRMIRPSLGFVFSVELGNMFVIGKCMKQTTFPFPLVFIAAIIHILLNVINAIKVAAFSGFYSGLTNDEINRSFIYRYDLTTIPVLMSQLPGRTFWLLTHFFFQLCIYIPVLSFSLETIMISLAEILPGSLGLRTKFPQNMILTSAVGIIGCGISIAALGEWEGWLAIDRHFPIFFVIFLVAVVLVPLSLSKVVNAGRETLFDFVSFQGTPKWKEARRRITLAMILIAGFIAMILVPITGLHHFMMFFFYGFTFVEIIVLLIIIFAALVQIILFCKQESRYPFCRSVGKKLNNEETVEIAMDDFGKNELS